MRTFAYNVAFSLIVSCPVAWCARQADLPWWFSVVLAVAAVAAAWKLLTVQIGVRKRSRYDLERLIQNMLVLKENGGWLDVKHRGSPLSIRVIRAGGGDASAEAVVAVPRGPWSEARLEDLARVFEQHGISFTTEPERFLRESSLVEARVDVPRLWDGTAGAKPARVAHLILDTFSVGPAELLDVRVEGAPSSHWKLHRSELSNL